MSAGAHASRSSRKKQSASALPYVSTLGLFMRVGTHPDRANAGQVDDWETRRDIPFREAVRSDSTRESLIELDPEDLAQIPGHPLAA